MSGVSTGTMIMGGLSAATSIGGGLLGGGAAGGSAAAAKQASLDKQAALGYNAQIDENLAEQADRDKVVVLQEADANAADTRLKNAAMLGSIRASYGASGLAMDGSPLDVIQATAIEGDMDVNKILYGGRLSAIQQIDKANSYRQQAMLARMGIASSQQESSIADSSASMGMMTSLISGLSGALRVGSSFFGGGRAGGSGGSASP